MPFDHARFHRVAPGLRGRSSGCALLVALAAAPVRAEVQPLPRTQWPVTVAAAVPKVLQALTPAQRSIVAGTRREDLVMLQGEWGDDVAALLGLAAGNAALRAAACGAPCPAPEATLRLMQAAWDVLQAPPGAAASVGR